MPDVPAEFTGEVSGFTGDSPETINAEGAQVEREADEAQPPVDEEAEAEAVIEPSSETLAELPVVAIQANQAETLAEETDGVLESGVVGEEMVFTDVEPQGTVPQAGAPSSEVEVEVPVVPSCEAQAPETSGEASVGGDLLISQVGYSAPTQSAIRKDLNLSLEEYSVFGSILTIGAMFGAITSGRITDFVGRKWIYISAFSIGMGAVPWVIMSEIGVGLMVLQQFGGINGIGFYLNETFQEAGLSSGKIGTIAYAILRVPITLVGALLMDKSGRRPLVMVSATGTFLGCFLTATGFLLKSHDALLRWVPILGVSGVLIFPINVKGAAGSLVVLVNWSGAWLVSFTFNFLMNWSMAGLLPCVALLLGLFLVPESPRWLAKVGLEKEFKTAFRQLRGKDANISHEVAEIEIGVGLMVLQQFGGINGIGFYLNETFQEAGLSSGKIGTIAYAILQVPITLVGALLMDKSGRRPLVMVSATGTFLGCFLTATGFLLKSHDALLRWVPILGVSGVLIYISAFSIGMGAVPWVIMSEIFPINVKGAAGSLIVLVNWSGAWLVSFTFNFLMNWSMAGETLKPYGSPIYEDPIL
ncbi:hypothetical protein Nepgr_031128 [Nepenthes gracilis]|uniref:Major facilitator superfamily (MFS) profile domain-containing protein n=1 Tax=Nepenthes gracilis TaxID=150966 RepID=A0AAD3TFY0_NEPGR|nr:hypothetical protein Nepgr_031128 [Nepenthes gracilis]